MQEFLSFLGFKVRDRVTGFEGVVSSLSFDLYGCVQAVVTPTYDAKGGKQPDSHWFDVKRLDKLGKSPVMPSPFFAGTRPGQEIGAADKPIPHGC